MDELDRPTWTADEHTEPESLIQNQTRVSTAHPTDDYEEAGPRRLRKFATWVFAIFCFFFFLMLKLPEARIQNLVIAHIRILAQEQGFLFSAEKVRIGILLGPSIKVYNAEFKAIDNERQTLKVPFLRVRPKIFSMLSSVKKVGVSADLLDGSLSGTLGASQSGAMVVDLSLDSLDLGTTAILKKFMPLDLMAKINGTVRLDFDNADPTKSEGALKLKVENFNAPAQSVYGFNLPKLAISESKINININKGKFDIREFDVGKDGKNDDIVGKVTGDGALSRSLDRSTISAKAIFSLSPSVMQSFPLLNALLSTAKTSDGKYSYRITGPLSGLEAQPGG